MLECAWIIGAEKGLNDILSASLRALFAKARCTIVAPRQISCGLPQKQSPRFVLIDLRDDASFETFTTHYDALCAAAPDARFVGITGDSIPLSCAVRAAHLLDGLLPYSRLTSRRSAQASALEKALLAAESPEECLGVGERRPTLVESQEYHELRGTERSYRSYEPDLFTLLQRLATIANRDVTSLLIGETGTGKTTLARILHELSDRRDGEFVQVACGTLSENLVASELFGHRRGAFTSADRDRIGKFEIAENGTILLDEIDVLNLENQAKLLRVLESGQYEPLGTHEVRTSTARIVVASNVCLDALMQEHRFRADLYYRLHQTKIKIPPLRDRRRDLAPLSMDIVYEHCRDESLCVERIEIAALELIHQYRWPGNIRELRNELRNAVFFTTDNVLCADAFSEMVLESVAEAAKCPPAPSGKGGLADDVASAERDAIELMLKKHNFNRSAAARELGISRVTLYSKLKKYDIGFEE